MATNWLSGIGRGLGFLGNAATAAMPYMQQAGANMNQANLMGAQMMQDNASTQNQILQIGAQMRAERRKTQAQIHQINQETNTKVAEMFRETYVNRRKSADKIHNKVQQLIMS